MAQHGYHPNGPAPLACIGSSSFEFYSTFIIDSLHAKELPKSILGDIVQWCIALVNCLVDDKAVTTTLLNIDQIVRDVPKFKNLKSFVNGYGLAQKAKKKSKLDGTKTIEYTWHFQGIFFLLRMCIIYTGP